jgi:hypothetical protein
MSNRSDFWSQNWNRSTLKNRSQNLFLHTQMELFSCKNQIPIQHRTKCPSNIASNTHPTLHQIPVHQLKRDQTLGCYLGKYLLKNRDIYPPELLVGWVFVREPICIIQLFKRPNPCSKLIPTQYKVFKNLDPGNNLNSYFLQIWNPRFLWEI